MNKEEVTKTKSEIIEENIWLWDRVCKLETWIEDFLDEVRCYSTGNSVLSEERVKELVEEIEG